MPSTLGVAGARADFVVERGDPAVVVHLDLARGTAGVVLHAGGEGTCLPDWAGPVHWARW